MEAEKVEKGRLASLDALRGFDMFWILLPTYPVFHALLVAMGFGGTWLDLQMEHPKWIGFTFYDTIYPLFLFMAGVSFPYSLAKSRSQGLGNGRLMLRILKRAAVLWLLGTTIFGSLQFEFDRHVLSSVLGRIGIAWGLAAIVHVWFGNRMRLAICLAVLVLYGALPFFVGCPGADGALPYASPARCIYAWLDSHFFPKPQIMEGASGVFCMIATAQMGMFAGEWLRVPDEVVPKTRKAGWIVCAGLACALIGLFVAGGLGRWSIPVIKLIWTPSYALVSAGYSLLMLTLFYWIVDIRGWRSWSFPLRVIGMNSAAAYLLSRTVFPWPGQMKFLFGGVMGLCPTPAWGEFVGEALFIVVYWLLLYLMYRKGIFLKV